MSTLHTPPEKERILNLLKCFIGFKSVSDSPNEKKECLDWVLAAFLGDQLSSVQRGNFEGSPWFYLPAKESKLLVFAHADVVPASEEMYALRVDGDKAQGRGVSDMKGHVLPFLMAFADSIQEGTVPPTSILITTDEEVAGNTIPHLLKEGIIQDPVAFTPDTDSKGIVTEHKGVAWSELIAHGAGGHGAYPWKTKNPSWLLAEALLAIQNAFPEGTQEDWQVTVSPTLLKGSFARNQVPDSATCGLDIRFPPELCATAEEALELVRKVLPDGCELNPVQLASPLKTDNNHPMVQLVKRVAEETLGIHIPLGREHGGTDARYFSDYGIPAFLYGPVGGGMHSEEEWVSIESLQKHYVMYRKLFEEL